MYATAVCGCAVNVTAVQKKFSECVNEVSVYDCYLYDNKHETSVFVTAVYVTAVFV